MRTWGVEVYGTEVQLQGREFVTKGNPNWRHVVATSNHILFQKEALINATVQRLPLEINQVAWIDADVEFTNPDWFGIAQALLAIRPVIQLFDEAVWTNQDGTEFRRKKSCALAGMDKTWRGHPGFAWAARRDLWNLYGGLYSRTPVGHGDTVFALACLNNDMMDHNNMYHGVGTNAMLHDSWRTPIGEWTGGDIIAVPGELWHEWHGDMGNRKYAERGIILPEFNHERHITIDDNGLLMWTDQAPQKMKDHVYNYFINRKEDGE